MCIWLSFMLELVQTDYHITKCKPTKNKIISQRKKNTIYSKQLILAEDIWSSNLYSSINKDTNWVNSLENQRITMCKHECCVCIVHSHYPPSAITHNENDRNYQQKIWQKIIKRASKWSLLLTSKSNPSWSMGMVYLRAKFCITPVRKAWVKKNPDTQNTCGFPLSNHSWRKRNLSSRSEM